MLQEITSDFAGCVTRLPRYAECMAMRIISGAHKGRRIESPEGKEVRPTTARTREAIFNILQHGEYGEADLLCGRVADIFCGSGAMGLEALSRGASHVTFVDKNRTSIDAVEFNLERFDEQKSARLIRADSTMLPPVAEPYQILFLDPPYHTGLAEKSLKTAHQGGWVDEGSVVMLELSAKEEVKFPAAYRVKEERRYGNSKVVILHLA